MAVAFGSTRSLTPATGTGGTSSSWSISGSNLLILVYIGFNDSTTTVSNVSWSLGSGTAVEVGMVRLGASNSTSIWAIPAPVAGSGTFTATLSTSVAYQITADYFTGCHQTTPCPSGDNATHSSSTTNGAAQSFSPSNVGANDAAAVAFTHSSVGDTTGLSAGTLSYESNSTATNMLSGYRLGAVPITTNAMSGGSGTLTTGLGVHIEEAAGGDPPITDASEKLRTVRSNLRFA